MALTFDDGYADNLHVALPILEKYEAPATVFIATSWVDRGEAFWWDQLSQLVWSMEPIPSALTLMLGDEEFVWRRPSGRLDRQSDMNHLHLAVWSRLLRATDVRRRSALKQLRQYVDTDIGDKPAARPMTRAELRRLAASPLVEIGAHTMSHCVLPDLPRDAQRNEIVGSKEQCRNLIGEAPSSFAYPFGRFDAGTSELVMSAGFERACSAENDLVWAGGDVSRLPRIRVGNCSARAFSMRLRFEWLP